MDHGGPPLLSAGSSTPQPQVQSLDDKYRDLAIMARDVLCIPITTVASESVFSHGGRIIGKYRISILPTNAEAVLCGRDWLEACDSEDEEAEEELPFNIQQMEQMKIH